MELQTLKVKVRRALGKGPVGRLRASGAVPGVLYGGGQAPLHIEMNTRAFEHLLHSRSGEHAVVQLDVEDDSTLNTPALLKVVQHHVVRGHAVHADFMRIRLDQRIVTSVPIETHGQPVGVRDGGILDHVLREVEVECLALEAPDSIGVDVSELKIGESVHAGQLALPENVALLTDPVKTVVAVLAPRVIAEPTPAEVVEEAAEPAAPEVIGKKEKEEEED
jgi:large subunit ribosomal protein L25